MNFGKNLRSTVSKLQQDDETSSYYGSNFSDDDNDSEYQKNIRKTRIKCIEGNEAAKKIQRKPTRTPDLRIQNRNALLARENRKRKKEIMESLEKNVASLQNENRNLHKMMKLKDSRISKLTKEVQYLKSVLSNQTEIVSILKSLPNYTRKPITESHNMNITSMDYSSKSSSDTLSCNTIDEDIEAEGISTDWDEILKSPLSSEFDCSSISKFDQPGLSPLLEISTEHNYYSHDDKQFEENDSLPGVCLHINTGRVSLEFCSVCHYNATKSLN